MDYRGQRATIMGLGHFGGGVAAARWLARQGAIVTVTDLADENTLADSLPLLADVPIAAVHLGGHREEDFRSADLSWSIRPCGPTARGCNSPASSGARLCTELELFIENCPARDHWRHRHNGKSTTAAMIAVDSEGRRTADVFGRQHRRQPVGATAADRPRRLGRAGNQQLPVVAFLHAPCGPPDMPTAYCRVTGCYAEPSRLAREFCRLRGGQAADSHGPNARGFRRAQHV